MTKEQREISVMRHARRVVLRTGEKPFSEALNLSWTRTREEMIERIRQTIKAAFDGIRETTCEGHPDRWITDAAFDAVVDEIERRKGENHE